jgi:hypothetical protein
MAFEHDGTFYEVDETGIPTGRILSPCGREWHWPDGRIETQSDQI